MAGPRSAPAATAAAASATPSPGLVQQQQQQQQQEDRTPYEAQRGGGGGAGGKLIRSKRLPTGGASGGTSGGIRRSTPYERPAQGRHASAGPQAAAQLTRDSAVHDPSIGKGLWLGGRLVSSASRILTSGASYLFSSFFGGRKNENLLPNAIVEKLELDDLETSEADGPLFERRGRPSNQSSYDEQEEAEFREMENLLKEKSFTREQYNHFIDLIKVKVTDNDVAADADAEALVPRDDGVTFEQPQPAPVLSQAFLAGPASHLDSQKWREERQRYWQEKVNGGRNKLSEQGDLDDQFPMNGKFQIEDSRISSPVEIAKEFMDRQLSRASGSAILSRRPALNDGGPLDRRSSLQLSVRDLNMQANGLQKVKTPFGEKLLSSSFHTPYVQSQNAVQRPGETLIKETKPKIGSNWTPYQTPITGGRQMLKRRSNFLEDEGTSTGPVRHTRIRTNSITSRGLLRTGRVLGTRTSNASEAPGTVLAVSSLRSNGPFSDAHRMSIDNPYMQEKRDEMRGLDSLAFVPVQSSRTAQTILETLERMSPSPKGKSLEEELALVRERPPTRLSPSMLNKQAQRTMQPYEAIKLHYQESPLIEDSKNKKSGEQLSFNPSKPSMLAVKEIEKPERTKGDDVLAVPLSLNTVDREAAGSGTSVPTLSGAHASSNNVLKVPVPSVSQQKSKGFRMSADFEERLSDDEGIVSTPAAVSSVVPLLSSKVEPSLPFSLSSAVNPMANLPSTSEAPVNSLAMAPQEEQITKSSVTTVSVAEASPIVSSSFTFPVSSKPGVNLDLPPTPKPIPAPPSQIDKPVLTAIPLPKIQDMKTSIIGAAPLVSSSSVERSETKEGSVSSIPGSTTQEPFGAKQPTNSSNLMVASSSIISQAFPQMGTASEHRTSASVSKTSKSTGFSSYVLSSGPGSSFSAPSFGFGGASSSSVSLIPQGASVSSAVHSTASTSSSPAIFGANSSFTGSVSQGSTFSSVFAASVSASTSSSVFATSSTLTAASSSEKSSTASQSTFALTAFGQGSNTSSQPMASSVVPTSLFGNNASTSGTFSAPFSFGNHAATSSPLSTFSFGNNSLAPSTGSATSKPAPSFGSMPFAFGSSASATSFVSPASVGSSGSAASTLSFGSAASVPSFGSAASTASPIFGATSGSTFNLSSAAPVMAGSASFSTGVTNVPSFGLSNTNAFGKFGQDTGLRSSTSSNENTLTSPFKISTPTSAGFGLSQNSSSSAPAFVFGSTPASSSPSTSLFQFSSSSGPTENPFSFGAKSSGAAQQPALFGSSQTLPTFGTPGNSVPSNDSNEQTIMEDSMAEEPSQVSPAVPSQPSLFGGTQPFTFGSAANNAPSGQVTFAFEAQQSAPAAPSLFGSSAAQNPFAQPTPPGGLEFAGGFALGSSGGDRTGRKFIKAKRTVRRGK